MAAAAVWKTAVSVAADRIIFGSYYIKILQLNCCGIFFCKEENSIIAQIIILMITSRLKLFTFLLLATLLPILGMAQVPKSITGYYVNSSGDTIMGSFPKYKDWTNNPEKVIFLPVNASESIILTPSNCTSFHAEDYDTYIAYSGNRLINPFTFNNGFDQRDSVSQYENVNAFIRVIFNYNDFKLLIFQHKDRFNIFYQKKNMQPVELICKSYSTGEDNFKTITTYRDQLKQIFIDTIIEKSLDQTLNRLSYDEGSLTYFMQKIYTVSKVKKKKNAIYKTSFFVNIGASLNFFSVSGDSYSFQQVSTKYNTTVSPVLTIGMYIPFERNFGKLGLSPQLSLYSYKNSGSYYTSINNSPHYTHSEFKTNLLIIPKVYITYKLVTNTNFEWNAGGGIGLAFVNGEKETFRDSGNYVFTTYDQGGKKNPFPTFNCQTGLVIKKKINFLINYSLPATITNFVSYNGKHSSLQFSIGYEF